MSSFIKELDAADILFWLFLLGAACYIICAIVYATFLMITEGLYLRQKQREQLKYENERDGLKGFDYNGQTVDFFFYLAAILRASVKEGFYYL